MATSLERELDPEGQKKWQCGTPYQYTIPGDGDHWQKLLEPKLEQDRIQCESWKDEVQNMLIFAGLFSAIVTAFVVVSYPSLQPDQNEIIINLLARIATRLDNPLNSTSSPILEPINPASLASPITSSSIRINVFWFISLVLSLTTALIGIVSLQWLREHQQYPNFLSSREKFVLFGMRAEGLVAWCIPQIFSSLPLFLQMALVLFFVGLIDFLLASSFIVAIPVIICIGIPLGFLIFTTTTPALQMFVFCLPLAGRVRKVPTQAPYKSTQSRLFRQLLTTSRTVFTFLAHVHYAIFYSLPSRFYPPIGRHGDILEHNADEEGFPTNRLRTVIYKVLHTSRSSSWISFDERWLVLRNTYAKSIFVKSWWMSDFRWRASHSSAPIYDLASTMTNVIGCYDLGGFNPTTLSLSYLCLQEMSSSINSNAPGVDHELNSMNNLYLQVLLYRSNRDLANPCPTFSSSLVNRSLEFMDDENRFIFLSQFRSKLPPFILQHFAELHIRMGNYLYHSNAHQLQQNLKFPYYPFGAFLYHYKNTRELFEGAISEQFSSFVRTYLGVITDPNINYDTLLTSLYGERISPIFDFAVQQESMERASVALDFLSRKIKDSIEGAFDRRSDVLFYVSSCYVCTLLGSRGCWHQLEPDYYDEHPVVAPFLSVLRQYFDARGTPDADLRPCLVTGNWEVWWDFLSHPRGQSSGPEESKMDEVSFGGPEANTTQPTNSEFPPSNLLLGSSYR